MDEETVLGDCIAGCCEISRQPMQSAQRYQVCSFAMLKVDKVGVEWSGVECRVVGRQVVLKTGCLVVVNCTCSLTCHTTGGPGLRVYLHQASTSR